MSERESELNKTYAGHLEALDGYALIRVSHRLDAVEMSCWCTLLTAEFNLHSA